MDTVPKIVLQNPYRILGVYANSPKRDIVSNKGKATAFLKVNRPVEYPLDLKGILPVPNRTLELMNEAEAHLAIAKEQIKFAQFWFLQKMTPLDDIAFNHLLAGNMAGAKEIWSKQESLSSLQNKLVCYLIENKPWLAVKTAEKLYEKFGADYIHKIDANCTLQMSATDLLHQFIDSLGEEIGMQKLLGYELGTETKAYISSQTVGPLINKISAEVEKTKKVDHKDPKARIEAARNLVRNTKDSFAQLKQLLPANDAQFVMIADKLGLEILQCGIDYFNKSDEDGRHQKAMKVQRYAQSIVVGTLAKQRCDENINILQGLIDKLPPEEVKKEQEHIQQRIALFLMFPAKVDDVLEILKNTCTDLVTIKETLGKNNPFYLQQATLVAQVALSKSIDALNEVQEKELPKLNGIGRSTAIEKVSHAFATSWEIMLWIELIDADAEFKEKRLKPNKAALKKILDQVNAFDSSSISRLFRDSYSVFEGCARSVEVDRYIYFTEKEMYAVCTSISACRKYIEKFPQGIHIENVRKKLEQLEDDQLFAKANTITELNNYLVKYSKGRHQKEARTKIAEIEEQHRRQREEEIRNLSRQIDSCKNIKNCISLKGQSGKYKSILLDKKLDDKLFSLCSSSEDYQQYLTVIGHFGQHAKEAERVIRHRKMLNNILWVIFIAISIFLIGCLILHLRNEEARKKAERIEQLNSMFELAVSSADADLCLEFLSTYPNTSYELRDSVKATLGRAIEMEADSLLAWHNDEENSLQEFVDRYSSNPYVNVSLSLDKVKERISEIDEQKEKMRQQKALEEEKARQRKEQEMYGTDARAWNTATKINTLAAYRDYLSRYPKGKHVDVANKRIIDLEVQQVINSGDYGYLPSSQKISSGISSKSTIHIRSRCDRTITIMYSGVNSMKIELPPHSSRTIFLKSGSYKVVATAPGVRSFYGTEDLTGGDYESEYYISTSRF